MVELKTRNSLLQKLSKVLPKCPSGSGKVLPADDKLWTDAVDREGDVIEAYFSV